MSKRFFKRSGKLVLVFWLAALLGCTSRTPIPPRVSQLDTVENPLDEYLIHRVTQPGETLALISKHYSGTTANWWKLIGNEARQKNEGIHFGRLVLIPKSLIVTESTLGENLAVGTNSR